MTQPMHEDLISTLLSTVNDTEDEHGEETNAPHLANALLRDVLKSRVTDVHVEPMSTGSLIRLRVDGALLDCGLVSQAQGNRIINQFRTLAELDPVASPTPEDARLSYSVDEELLDIRIASAPTLRGEKLAVRVQRPGQLEHEIQALGMRPETLEKIQTWIDAVEGMFLVTGPTASGKTTTLYALLNELKSRDRSLVTLEDPVEFSIDEVTQLQVNIEQGLTFSEGIKTMLRLDPESLLIGEIRGENSARAAIDAAVSGRVLLSTLHSRDAVGAITSLRNWGLADFEIATVVSTVVGQRLVRKLCTNCREKRAPTDKQKRWLQNMELDVPDEVFAANGCDECNNLGYRGRTGVFEVWQLGEDDWDAIREHTHERAIRDQLARGGHQFMLSDALAKAEQGITDLDEVRSLAGLRPAVHAAPLQSQKAQST